MCGLAGSHHWQGTGIAADRASTSSGRRSMTSQLSANPWSSKSMPVAPRTHEFAPSAPMTYRARTVVVSSVGSRCPISGSRMRRSVSST